LPNPRFIPYWLDRLSRRPRYPRARGELTTEVAVIGGGLTGCAAAYAFAAAGVRVVLVEQGRIGESTTSGRSSGLLLPEPGPPFDELVRLHGVRAARALAQGSRRAALEFAALVRRLGLNCRPEPIEVIRVARADRDHERRLQREARARREAGLEAPWLRPPQLARETAVDAGLAGLRLRDGLQVDPLRAALGLARAAGARGARIFERTAALRIRSSRRAVEIRTAGGSIRADAVVVATGLPPPDVRGLKRHFDPRRIYFVVTDPLPAPVARAVGRRAAALRDLASPPHTLRWMPDGRVLFSGADGPDLPARAQSRVIVQRAGQLMYELSLVYPAISGIPAAWAWDALVGIAADGVPCIGPHRNYPRHLFALGIDPHHLGFCWLAARLLVRRYQGAAERDDEVFGFGRILE
jgi:gamma-glutamylputrescine oxidase